VTPRRKGVFVILDGVGDRPCPELDGLTPLQAAKTPNLDRLAERGACGLMDPLAPGIAVGTHTGTALLMGLPKRQVELLARGPVEAAGIGVPLQSGDVAIRCNFATLRENAGRLEVTDRRAGRISEGTESLTALLQDVEVGDGIRGSLYPATQHRAVLQLTGDNLSSAITDTDPGTQPLPTPVQESHALNPGDRQAELTAQAVNRFVKIAHQRLGEAELNEERRQQGLPGANGVITRGAGKLEPLDSIVNHYGLRAAVIAGEDTVLGLAHIFGYTPVEDASFTALPDTDLKVKVAATLDMMAQHDLVFLHIKGPDISAHDQKPGEKKELLERIDGELVPLLLEDAVVTVTGDHSTDSNSGAHCGDPVPAVLFSPQGRKDPCRLFSESGCLNGGLGRLSATELLISMLDAMDALHQFKRNELPLLYF
jgi:2,3-bisphosphoglycerate-independent phosphoglycerate mutase